MEAMLTAGGYAFPSGHAMGSMIAFSALAYLGGRILPDWKRQAAVVALAATCIATVGLSRIYLGAHWVSDIAAGFTIGLVWLSIDDRVRGLAAASRDPRTEAQVEGELMCRSGTDYSSF